MRKLNNMKKIFLLLIIVAFISCGKKEEEINIEGVYLTTFTGTYNDFNTESPKKWDRTQYMKILKINDSTYNVCIFEDNQNVYNTISTWKIKSTLIEGSFYYDYYGWKEGLLFGYFLDDKITGFFKAETSIDIWPEFGSSMTVPVNGKFIMIKENINN